MEQFKLALEEAVKSFVKLSEEWEKVDVEASDLLSEKYPFHKDFQEILHDMMEWKEHISSS